MDSKSLELLEFPRVREIICGYADFSASEGLALELTPSTDPDVVRSLLKHSTEARRLLSLNPEFSVRGALDVREDAVLAARGKVLEPGALVDVELTLAAARRVRAGLRKAAGEVPSLWEIGERIVELPDLENEIGRCFTPRAELLDTASAKLAELRHRLKEARQQLTDRLESIIKSDGGRRFVQAAYIDEREGRYVIPVKVERRKEVEGIVHDISNTGATVFIEPWSTVELGNELRQVAIEERREVERILTVLSSHVGAHEEEIGLNVASLAEIDLALAKARYADAVKAVEPVVASSGEVGERGEGPEYHVLRLVEARHPLLRERAVPLSVEIGDDYSVLVITGPNTGGKTVALKTIGLLTLMTQAGIPIPASGESRIPVFDRVFVDIGDEQSIEQTLSSFSWHMGNTVRIIRESTARSLVLLDEMGTATDPNEGSALARAILKHFLQSGAMVVATTHYGDLKVFAHATPGMRNASLDFDPVTLAPTYHLTMGIPGGSNALAIATQLGLSLEIVDSARGMLGSGTQEVEALLAELMGEKQKAESLRRETERERDEAERLRSGLDEEYRRLKEEEQRILQRASERITNESDELRRQIREAATELKKTRSEEKIEEARRKLDEVRKQLRSETWRPGTGDETGEAPQLAVGDSVWLDDVRVWGTVLSLSDDEGQLEVQVGHTRLKLCMDDVGEVRPALGEQLHGQPAVGKKLVRRTPSLELDLRGRRADEVEPELDTYLNDASLAGLGRVRVIHGFGTGTVRQIVRDLLASHSLVRSFRPGEQGEGGDGVTVVEL